MAVDSSRGLSSALAGGADTVVARATPEGRSALGVVRVTGPDVARVAASLCPGLRLDRPWRAQLAELRDAEGRSLERAVVIPYRAPRSFTGEDMLELMVHGSPALLTALVEACVRAGCRPAAPGEFTRRAVANGKMDLVQAEGLRDLIEADTARQLGAARLQAAGHLSDQLRDLRVELVGALGEVEAALDFVDQGVGLDRASLARRVEMCRSRIDSLLETAWAGRRLRGGVRVAILGAVNAGKSTLFNRLVGSDRAIVSPRPGTTRDLIEAGVEIRGLRVVLVDTAGLRAGGDAVEAEGVERAHRAGQEADVLLIVHAADAGEWSGPPPVDRPWLGVLNKVDLAPEAAEPAQGDWVRTSATSGQGIDRLERALGKMVSAGLDRLEGRVAIGERHRAGLEAAAAELDGLAVEHPELAAEHLRWAAASLAELIGEVAAEDVLDRVFETFCLGK